MRLKNDMNSVASSVLEPINLCDTEEQQIIAHISNDVGAFGAGVAGQIAKKWPNVKAHYLEVKKTGYVLGCSQIVRVSPRLSIVNMIAQHGLRSSSNPTDYRALDLS